jgi:hypothetical protein
MSFLGNPCACGWSLTEFGALLRECDKCGRRYVRTEWGWDQITPKEKILSVEFCAHRRVIGDDCPHCVDGVAKAKL